MAQEFTINSSAIESKINQLLPSQGGFGAGVDFSASTMVIPIVDLTETAEGSNLRQDLQTSLSLNSVTSFSVINTTSTLVTTTGYYRVFGNLRGITSETQDKEVKFSITDGVTTKIVYHIKSLQGILGSLNETFDFIVLLQAGDSLTCTSAASFYTTGCTRQIADLSGQLVDP